MPNPKTPPKPRLAGARRQPPAALEMAGSIENREQNKATARILTVLSSFASNVGEFGISELSQHLGMTKNMVFRAVKTLVEQDYIVRDASGQRYQLGFRVLELQNTASPEPTFRTLCAPYVLQIHELTGETVSLNVRALDYMVFIDGIETRKPGVWRLQIGALRPLFATASGLALLAFCDDAEIDGYIARQSAAGTGHDIDVQKGDTPLNPARLWEDIRLIRQRGYAKVLRQTALPNLSLSFPIWDAENKLHGVLSVGGPNERFGPQLDGLLPKILDIMEALCHRTRLYTANVAGSEITL